MTVASSGETRGGEKHGFVLVGIGASAGGVTATKRFFQHVSKESGMAYVVVMHLSREHESHLAEILQNATGLKVVQVRESVTVEPNHVYVIPPAQHLVMDDGTLKLKDPEQARGQRVPIDLFFRTLAEAYGKNAVAVILSGSGSDGSLGLQRVKERGGLTVVQDPEEAEFDSMPRSALTTGLIDLVLPVAEIPERLQRFVQSSKPDLEALMASTPDSEPLEAEPEGEAAVGGDSLRDVLALVKSQTGHDFGYYKLPTLRRRIARRLQVHELGELGAYLELLRSQPDEVNALLRDLLITVTNFFRDPDAFGALETEVIPKLFVGKTGDDAVRVWVAGCASGEEAYSLGMLLLEHADTLPDPPKIQIFASDINDQAIRVAREGRYNETIAVDVNPERLHRFFTKDANMYRVKKELRELVLFAPHNLLRDPPFSKLDLLTCRNLLIYLNRSTQERVMEIFHFALRSGGYLFLGSSESAEGSSALFTTLNKKERLFRTRSIVLRPGYSGPPSMPASGFSIATWATPSSKQRGSWPLENWTGEQVSPWELGQWLPAPLEAAVTEANRHMPFGDLHFQLLEQLAPPSVLIDEHYDILHASQNAVRFLRFTVGEPSRNLLKVALPGLILDLRAAVLAVAKDGRPAEAQRVSVDLDGAERFVKLTVRPAKEEYSGLLLVTFEEQPPSATPEPPQSVSEVLRGDRAIESMVQRLEEEAQTSRDRLQTTVEQYETSTEELKASNEELQAINEELRSASEEFETSKEELQSLNEELTTVNHELREKVDEVSRINTDLQNLMSATDIGMIFLDRSLSIKRYTPRTLDIFNLIPSDLGRPFQHVTHKLEYDRLTQDAAQVLSSLQSRAFEVNDALSGTLYLARLSPYQTSDGQVDGVVLSFVDITEMKRTTAALHESEERFKAIVNQATAGIAQSDLDGNFVFFNDRFCEITGNTLEGLRTKTLPQIVDAENPEPGQSSFQQMVRDGTPFTVEKPHAQPDGAVVWVSHSVSPIVDGMKQQRYALAVSVDITERKIADRSLQESDRRKDEFLATLSHELRNPLNALRSSIEVMGRLNVMTELQAVREMAQQPLETIRRLIDDLLDVGRISQGKIRLSFAPTELSQVLKSAVNQLGSRFSENSNDLTLELPATLGVVSGDALRLQQVFTNLLSNAIKYSSPGSRIVLAAERHQHEVEIRIRDSGIGISSDELHSVFDLFSQVVTPGDRPQDGLGIGLYLVKYIVENHGGSVKADSAGLGEGSLFTVRLPLQQALDSQPTEAQSSPLKGEPARDRTDGQDAAADHAWRILLVDDYESARKAVGRLLKFMGHEVVTAADGSEALALADEFRPELILLDINMPGMNGYEVARALRAQPKFAKTVLIALTGYGQAEDIRQAHEAGFDDHIVKPLDPDALERLLEDYRKPAANPVG